MLGRIHLDLLRSIPPCHTEKKKKPILVKYINKRLNCMMFTYGFAYSIVIFVVDSWSVPTINWDLPSTVQN